MIFQNMTETRLNRSTLVPEVFLEFHDSLSPFDGLVLFHVKTNLKKILWDQGSLKETLKALQTEI